MDVKFKRQLLIRLFIFALLTNKITEPMMFGRYIIYSFFCKRIRNTRFFLEQSNTIKYYSHILKPQMKGTIYHYIFWSLNKVLYLHAEFEDDRSE